MAAAVVFIDESGLPLLTMKRLGQMLEVESMSLYRYVPDKSHLLDAVAETIVDEISVDPAVFHEPTNGWQHFLRHLAHGVRRMALRHPNAFPLLASHPPGASGLRAPLRNLYWAEAVMAGLTAEGFSDEIAMATYRAFSRFLLGHLLQEVAPRSDVMNHYLLDDLDAMQDRNRRSAFPTLARLQRGPSHSNASIEFDASLEGLLSLIALQRS